MVTILIEFVHLKSILRKDTLNDLSKVASIALICSVVNFVCDVSIDVTTLFDVNAVIIAG